VTEVSVDVTTTCDTCVKITPTLAQLLRSWGEVPGPTGFHGSRNQQNPVRGSRRRVQPKPVRRELRHTQANIRVCRRPDNTEVRHCRTEDVSLPQSRTICRMACLPRHQATCLRSGRRILRDQRPCSMVQPSLQGQGHRTRRHEGRKPGMSIIPRVLGVHCSRHLQHVLRPPLYLTSFSVKMQGTPRRDSIVVICCCSCCRQAYCQIGEMTVRP
jgi:hypothetical protein